MVRDRDFWTDTQGAGAAEFALVVPLLMLLIFGIIDAGRFMWEYNRAEKATQVGARMAVVTNVMPQGLATTNYVGVNVGGVTLTQGDRIPAAALSTITCTQTGCTPANGTTDTSAFNAIVTRMQYMLPQINASNVTVEYRGSGLGFAGNPNGIDISPLVTVKLSGVPFRPIWWFPVLTLTMPSFETTLTAEDLDGADSN